MELFNFFDCLYNQYNQFMYVDLLPCNFAQLIYSNFESVHSLDFSTYKIMSLVNRYSWTSSFPTWSLLYHFLA